MKLGIFSGDYFAMRNRCTELAVKNTVRAVTTVLIGSLVIFTPTSLLFARTPSSLTPTCESLSCPRDPDYTTQCLELYKACESVLLDLTLLCTNCETHECFVECKPYMEELAEVSPECQLKDQVCAP